MQGNLWQQLQLMAIRFIEKQSIAKSQGYLFDLLYSKIDYLQNKADSSQGKYLLTKTKIK